MSNLFARAASLLLRYPDPGEAEGTGDVRQLLDLLGYAPAEATDGETRHRARLLEAASRFTRVFELAAPDAPGLVAFGAEFDPALADPLHQGSPLVGVSGVGLSAREAFQGCVGEGIEYLSQLQHGSDLVLPPSAGDAVAAPQTQAFIAALAEHRLRADRGLSWHRARRLTDNSEVLLPADVCLRRPPDQRELTPPFALSTGSAAGTSWEAAALHGLLELIERDAASLWWHGGRLGRAIPPQHEAAAASVTLLSQLRQDIPAPRRSWLLDITTDLGVPCAVAVSCRPDGFDFAIGVAARPTLKAAAHSAIMELCQIELAQAVVEAKRAERGEAALNARDRIHLKRATAINADRCPLLQRVAGGVDHLAIDIADSRAALASIVRRLEMLGIETFGLDLTRPQFAVPVARVMAPGLQLEPSQIVTARLSGMIARTGGGTRYTGGVALM